MNGRKKFTLAEAKSIIAQRNGFKTFDELTKACILSKIQKYNDEAAELYAAVTSTTKGEEIWERAISEFKRLNEPKFYDINEKTFIYPLYRNHFKKH